MKYIVVALAVKGLKTVHKVGETVTDEDFERGEVEEKEKEGFIKKKEEKANKK